jgi:hypothetical protein
MTRGKTRLHLARPLETQQTRQHNAYYVKNQNRNEPK